MKKVYLACSIAGGRDHAHVYADIVQYIQDAGGQVLSDIFADPSLTSEVGHTKDLTPRAIWERDMNWVRSADYIVAEVTNPSLGVGYELAMAEQLGIPVLALYCKTPGRRLSAMIEGSPHPTVVTYQDIHETKTAIQKFLA